MLINTSKCLNFDIFHKCFSHSLNFVNRNFFFLGWCGKIELTDGWFGEGGPLIEIFLSKEFVEWLSDLSDKSRVKVEAAGSWSRALRYLKRMKFRMSAFERRRMLQEVSIKIFIVVFS